jgi:hypothetical protein
MLAVCPVSVQLVVAEPAVKLFVPLTKIEPWLTRLRVLRNGAGGLKNRGPLVLVARDRNPGAAQQGGVAAS